MWSVALGIASAALIFYLCMTLVILLIRFNNPPTTAVQTQRKIEAFMAHRQYHKRQIYFPLARIAPDLQYATIAAEDGRFYVHHGFDWVELEKVVKGDMAKKKLGRGASTITQQLVKNLFLGTERSIIKKGIEFTLVPLVELLIPKDRILELYLNVIEWGPGIYGAEAAAGYWYHTPVDKLSRNQAARLAAIIPNPLHRNPATENEYSEEILHRMQQMGW